MAIKLTRNTAGTSVTFNTVTSFRHTVSRYAEAMPLPGGEEDGDPESGAMIWDIGGTRIEYNFEFIEYFDNENDLYDRYRQLDNFFATIQMMEGLTLEVDENDWTSASGTARQAVLKSFELERRQGEANVLYGRVSLLGGKLI